MRIKIHHYLHDSPSSRAHAGRRHCAGKQRPARHYTARIGNRNEALRLLEDAFGINDGRITPESVLY